MILDWDLQMKDPVIVFAGTKTEDLCVQMFSAHLASFSPLYLWFINVHFLLNQYELR